MAIYDYIARGPNGQKTTGSLEAASEAAALRALGDQRLFPIRVSPKQEAGARTGGVRVSVRELGAFYEQLADLLRAGVPMLRSIETLGRTNKKLTPVLAKVQERVASGKSLSEAMGEQASVFNPLQMAMVRAGERGGFLEDVLADLSKYMERQDELKSKVQAAMIYPLVLVMLGIGAVLISLIWLVPKFKPLFKGMSLPLPSQVLFFASDAVLEYWPVTLGVGFLVGLGAVMFVSSEQGKSLWAEWQLKVPVLGKTILMVNLTRFCRILGTMMASGVPILQALQISRDASGCIPLARNIDLAAESVREGQGLTKPLRKGGLIPEQILEMMAVAEESNQLEKVLLKVADTVERRTNQQVDQAVKLLEPLILVVLAGSIFFIALGVLYPIFTMSQTIR